MNELEWIGEWIGINKHKQEDNVDQEYLIKFLTLSWIWNKIV